jgi:hypothetical protein
VTTNLRVSGRSDLDTGEAGTGRSNVPMDMVIEMAMAVAAITTEAECATIFGPTERNEMGIRRRTSEVPAGPSDWRSRIERTIRQQSLELTQLYRMVVHLVCLVEAQASREEAPQLAMMRSLQERQQQWDG